MKNIEAHSVIQSIGALSNEGLFIYDAKTNSLEYVNESITQIFQISHKQFQHQYTFFINHILPDDMPMLLEKFEMLKSNFVVENVEFRVKGHDVGIKTLKCNAYLINERVIGFVRDTSGERELETYAVNFGAKKNSLLDMVSHNLSSLLNVSTNLLISMDKAISTETNPDLKRHVNLIRENTNHCLDILNDFFQEEHFVSERIFTKKVRFNIIAKTDLLLDQLRGSYPGKTFRLRVDTNVLFINNDEVKFLQILNNLLSNAVKFTAEDGVIELQIEDKGRHVVIHITDNGIGIPEALKPTLFDKYTPSARLGLRGEVSIGMGLYIVKQLLDLLGGNIVVVSSEGAGSTFSVTIPK
jgi:two-component system, OmpR family, sensor histidine kinase VicK